MKTLLMISHSSSPTGGGEEDFLRLLKYLHTKFNLIGIFPEGKRVTEYKKYVSDYLIIPDRMFPFTGINLKKYAGYFVRAFEKKQLIKSFLSNKKISLAYIHSSVCLYEIFAITELEIPYVISIREFINPPFIRKIIYKYFLKTSRKIIVISKSLETEFKKIDERSDKIVLIYLAIETTKENYRTGLSNKIVILNIGNIFPQKGQDKVIEAVSRLHKLNQINNNIQVKIIGAVSDRDYYQFLKDLTKKYHLSDIVEFSGEMQREEVMKEIESCQFVIISSMQEGFSLVLLETLSKKKPVISTKVGVVPEIIIDMENGLLYDFENTNMLAEKINLLVTDQDFRLKIANNGYKIFTEKFDLQASLKKITNVFEENL